MAARVFSGLPLLVLLSATAGRAQSLGCDRMRTGTFVVVAPTHSATRIIRTGKKQVEINDSLGLEAHYRVRWVNGCTYQLYDRKLVRGTDRVARRKGDVLTVRITNVLPRGYQATVSANFADLVLPMTLALVP